MQQSDNKMQKHLSSLESGATPNDFEFKKNENHYLDAVKDMEELVEFLEKHNLDTFRKKTVKELEDMLEEMYALLKNKSYKKFLDKYNEFRGLLKNLYSGMKKRHRKSIFADEHSPQPALKTKRGVWESFKNHGKKITEAIFNPKAEKINYDSTVLTLGKKLSTNASAQKKEPVNSEAVADEAYPQFAGALEKIDKNEKIEKRLANFKTQVETADILPEEKEAFLEKLEVISSKNHTDLETIKKERGDEIKLALDAYIQGKISGIKITQDVISFSTSAMGLSALRGTSYAGAAAVEKTKKEHSKQMLNKNVLVNSAIETAGFLSLSDEKKTAGFGFKTKLVDPAKALAAVARGFEIDDTSFSGINLTKQNFDGLIDQLKQQGADKLISENFIKNSERVWHLYNHSTEGKNSEPTTHSHRKDVKNTKEVDSPNEPLPVTTEQFAGTRIAEYLEQSGSNQQDFIDNLQNLRIEFVRQIEDSLILTDGSDKFLQEKIDALYELQENYKGILEHNMLVDNNDLIQIKRLIDVGKIFKSGQPDWPIQLSKIVFNNNDASVFQLALSPHQNAKSQPILTNHSNAVRIWNANENKDVLWYEKNTVFNTDKNGNLLAGEHIMEKNSVIKMANEELK